VPELEELRSRVLRCFEAGAVATGATMTVLGGTAPYEPLRTDNDVAEIFGRNLHEFSGREFPIIGAGLPTSAGTDMGNVSVAVPTIHPMLGLDSFPVVNHQAEFTGYCTGDRAHSAIIDGAIGMAWTAAEVAMTEHLRQRLLSPGAP
jgi:metal-dependent amidase/aminoacylase/carboxypeptidase family protein